MTVNIDMDSEFLDEDGKTIELISIAFVADSGYSLYCINRDAPWDRIYKNPWLMKHVVPSLPLKTWTGVFAGGLEWDLLHPDYERVMPKTEIADRVKKFISQYADPQLWAYYGAYDFVVLAQLWGRMIDMPSGVPMFTNELRQEIRRLGNPRVPEQTFGYHNVLEDARHQRRVREYLQYLEAKKGN